MEHATTIAYAVGGWSVFIGSAYYLWTQSQNGKGKRTAAGVPRRQSVLPDQIVPTQNERKKRRRDQNKRSPDEASPAPASAPAVLVESASNAVRSRKKAVKPSKASEGGSVIVIEAQTNGVVENELVPEGIDNNDFAQRLAGAQRGTDLKKKDEKTLSKSQAKKQKKKARQNGQLEVPASASEMSLMSTPMSSSVADEDMSSVPSSNLEIESQDAPGGIADMLEAPTAGPGTLRIKEDQSWHAVIKKKPAKKSPTQQEPDKKALYRQRKNEEEKAQRREVEADRRVRMEAQRRTARIAEGRPAKNGEILAPAPAKSAWSARAKSTSPTSNGTDDFGAMNGALLDTLDASTNGKGNKKANDTTEMVNDDVTFKAKNDNKENEVKDVFADETTNDTDGGEWTKV